MTFSLAAIAGPIGALCIFMHCTPASIAAPLSTEDRAEARRLLESVWTAEPLMTAALQTSDRSEMSLQSLVLIRAASSAPRDVVLRSPCFTAANTMSAMASGLASAMESGLDARRLVALKSDFATWSKSVAQCEAALGERRTRKFALDLDR